MENENKCIPLHGMFREAIISSLNNKGMSQAELCRQLGLNRGNFNSFLKGGTFPLEDIERVVIHLGLTLKEEKNSYIVVNIEGKEQILDIKEIKIEL